MCIQPVLLHSGLNLSEEDLAFIETSSPEAAREIKKRFDKFIGVSAAYRSPYAITSFKNQHGRDRYRVGYALTANHSPQMTDASCG